MVVVLVVMEEVVVVAEVCHIEQKKIHFLLTDKRPHPLSLMQVLSHCNHMTGSHEGSHGWIT